MASGGEIIKEFVVSIKYVVDDAEFRKAQNDLTLGFGGLNKGIKSGLSNLDDFIGGFITGSLKDMAGWAAGLSATLAGVGIAVARVTDNFSDLYYYQQKLAGVFNATGTSMMLLQNMGQLSGLGKNSLLEMLSNVATELRDLPKGSFLESLTGGEKDPEKAILKLAKFYGSLSDSKADQYYKRQIERFIGVDPETMRRLGQNLGDLQKYLDETTKMISVTGLNPDQLMKMSIDFQRNLDEVEQLLQIVAARAVSAILPSIISGLQSFSTWLVSNGPEINKVITELPGAMDSFLRMLKLFIAITHPLAFAAGATAWDLSQSPLNPNAPSAKNPDKTERPFLQRLFDWLQHGEAPLATNYTDIQKQDLEQEKAVRKAQGLPPTESKPTPAPQKPVTVESKLTSDKPVNVNVKKSEDKPFGAAGQWIYSNFLSPMSDFLFGRHHSPFVEIWDAKNFWPLVTSWLHGSATRIPLVKVQNSEENKDKEIIKRILDLAEQIRNQNTSTKGQSDKPSTLFDDANNMLESGTALNANPDQLAPQGPGITTVQQQQNLLQGVKFFENKGLSEQQAIGIVSRLFAESGLNPNAVNPTSGAYGIAQWLGSRKNAALNTQGDFNKQLQLVWDELNSTEKTALSAIKVAKTAPQAANAMELYERANDPKFTAHADALASFFSKQLLDKLSALTDNVTRANAHLSKPPVGTAPIPAVGGRNLHFSPSTTIHVTARGSEMGAIVFNATARAHSTLYRNYYSKIS